MDHAISAALIRELQGQVSSLLAAQQLLTPLVREKGQPKDEEHLAMANQSLYRLTRTIRHLELCQDQSLTLLEAPMDLGRLCRELGRSMETAASELDVSFWWELDKENLLLVADRYLLEQALLNLLTNAFQAAGKGGRVVLRMAVKGESVLLSVEDNGPGLAAQAPSSDPFLKRPGGVGLGLEAARQVARLHGGALVLEDRDPGGVKAVLSLPVRKPTADTLVKTPPSDPTGGLSPFLVELSPLLPWQMYLPDNLD